MVDSSLSELKDMEFETGAAARFIAQVVRPGDRVAVFEFSDAVTQLRTFPTTCRACRRQCGTSLRATAPRSTMRCSRRPRRWSEAAPDAAARLVLLTDAGETTSRADFETARRAAVRAEALLYTIVIRPVHNENGRNTAGEHALETIADTTGGAMYYPG